MLSRFNPPMSDTDIRTIVEPLLERGEDIIWSIRTKPNAREASMAELLEQALKQSKNTLAMVVIGTILWLALPFMGLIESFTQWDHISFAMMIFILVASDYFGIMHGYWKIKRLTIGGYVLTRRHLFELDEDHNIHRKLDATSVKYALKNGKGIVLAPLGTHLNSGHQLYWLPPEITTDTLQAVING